VNAAAPRLEKMSVSFNNENDLIIFDVFKVLENFGGSLVQAKVDCETRFISGTDRGERISFHFPKLEHLGSYEGPLRFFYKFRNLETFTVDYSNVSGAAASQYIRGFFALKNKVRDEIPKLKYFRDEVREERYCRGSDTLRFM